MRALNSNISKGLNHAFVACLLIGQSYICVGQTTFYSNISGSGSLNVLSNWNDARDGSGSSPGSFTNSSDVFVVQNADEMTLTGNDNDHTMPNMLVENGGTIRVIFNNGGADASPTQTTLAISGQLTIESGGEVTIRRNGSLSVTDTTFIQSGGLLEGRHVNSDINLGVLETQEDVSLGSSGFSTTDWTISSFVTADGSTSDTIFFLAANTFSISGAVDIAGTHIVDLQVVPTFGGDVTIDGTLHLDLTSEELTVSGNVVGTGTLHLSNSGNNLNVGGDLTVETLTIDDASAVITLNGSGSQTLGIEESINLLTINNSSSSDSVKVSSNITVAQTLTVSDGNFSFVNAGSAYTISLEDISIASSGTFHLGNASNLTIDGNITNNGSIAGGTSTLTLNVDANQSISGTGITTFHNLIQNKTLTNDQLTLNQNITTTGDFTLTDGVFDVNGNTYDADGSVTIVSTGTLQGDGIIQIGGDFIVNGNFADQDGTVEFNGTSSQSTSEDRFYNLIFNNSGVSSTLTFTTASSAVAIENFLTITDGSVSLGTKRLNGVNFFIDTNGELLGGSSQIVFDGDFTNNGNFDGETGTFRMDLATSSTLSGTGTTAANNFRISKTNATDSVVIDATVTVNGNLIWDADDLGSIFLDDNGVFDVHDDVSIPSACFLNNGTGTLQLTGNLSNSGTFIDSTGTTELDGTTSQTISNISTFHNLTLNNSGTSTLLTTDGSLAVEGRLTISDGEFDLNANSLNVLNVSIGVNGELDADQSTVNLEGDFANDGTFTGAASTVIIDGNDDQDFSGSNTITFNDLQLNNTGTGTGMISNTDIIIAGSFTFTDGDIDLGSQSLTVSGISVPSGSALNGNTGTLNVSGDLSVSGTFVANTSTVDFNGSSAQAINSALTFYNLTKSGGGDLTLNDNITVSNTLTLTSGDIISSISNLLTLASGASISGASSSSHINGVLGLTVNTDSEITLTFPLGDGTSYRPIDLTIDQNTTTTTVYTTSLINGTPTSRTIPSPVVKVSSLRYYNITKSSAVGIAAASIDISYNADDDVKNQSSLHILKESGSVWLDLAGNVTGNATSGTISSSNNFTDFGDFVLGSEQSGALPVTLINFRGLRTQNGNKLFWSTATEVNNGYFELERSFDQRSFRGIGKIDGFGNSSVRRDYSFMDSRTRAEISTFYRLKQVDTDGTFTYSEVIQVHGSHTDKIDLSVSPIPNNGYMKIQVHSPIISKEGMSVSLIDIYGKIHSHEVYKAITRSQFVTTIDLKNTLPAGQYILVLHYGSKRISQKVIVNP